jgi:hypothetical protein
MVLVLTCGFDVRFDRMDQYILDSEALTGN